MNIWHDTVDAPRRPRRLSPGVPIEIVIGTWPIGPEQHVWITWRVGSNQDETHGTAIAEWQRNSDVNSYWIARVGPFADGDRVTYTVHGRSSENATQTGPFSLGVTPALDVALLWHQHQPLYRDPAATNAAGSYRQPWVRLHGIRDYYCMAALAAEYDVRVTFNLTPVLLRQLDDYVMNGATDGALELTRQPAEQLTRAQVDDLLSTFFDADWHHQVYVHERYRELFEKRIARGRFSPQDLRDLQMWFNLAWFGHEFRTGDVRLITGETVRICRFVRQARGFSHDDVLEMVEDQYKILRAIVPLHRVLQDSGHIEVSTTPSFHPILPLLVDTDAAYIDRPGTSYPMRFAHPEDAAVQVERACRDYLSRFDRRPSGMWPAEGAVSSDAVDLIRRNDINWIATDAGVLERSGRWGYRTSDPDVLCRPYRVSDADASIAVFFRDTDLSDRIGFRYGQCEDADAAARDFIHEIATRVLDRLTGDEDRVLTIALDGENAWGGYLDDGRPFLRALYRQLSSDARLKTVTFSEFLHGNPARGLGAHPAAQLSRVFELATGSWIDEPGSRPGVDLGTWIGEPEENAAWNLLGMARSDIDRMRDYPGFERSYDALLAAEGSDWFWWFGSDQDSGKDPEFDELFRAHVRAAYRALDLEAPEALDNAIVAHPVLWTFTHPVPTIRRRDELAIRTNCPGRLTYRIDDSHEQSKVLTAVGGVMAGARHFQIILGPFPASAHRLEFRFDCEHPGCRHESACCLSGQQKIALRSRRGRQTTTRPPDAAPASGL